MVLTGVSVPPKSKTNPGKRQERTIGKKILLILGILLIISSLCGFGFYGYIYIFRYLPQYNKWYGELPEPAIEELTNIKLMATMENKIRSLENRNNNQNTITL